MGFFDRFRKASPAPPARKQAQENGPRWVVPEGHRVTLYPARGAAGVSEAAGGAQIVRVDTLDIMAALRAQASPRPGRRVFLAEEAGLLSALCAPSNPRVTEKSDLLVVVLQRSAIKNISQEPARALALLREIHALQHVRGPGERRSIWCY